MWKEKPALVSRTISLSNNMFPASWVLNESGEYEVFEYSSDPLVNKHWQLLKTFPDLFRV